MTDDTSKSYSPITSELVREDADFAEIVQIFVEGLDGRLKDMETALRQSDWDALRVSAHQLKGAGGGYGYPLLTERAAELEIMAKAQVLEECMDAVADLKDLVSRVEVGPSA